MHRSRLTCALTTYRHTLRPGREDMYFIVASAFSISAVSAVSADSTVSVINSVGP